MKKIILFIIILFVISACNSSTGNVVQDIQYQQVVLAPPKIPINHEMNISHFNFVPNKITINKGDRITFTNNNGRRHKIQEQSYRMFESPWLEIGQFYTHTFSNKGEITIELIDFDMQNPTKRRKRRQSSPLKTAFIEVK